MNHDKTVCYARNISFAEIGEEGQMGNWQAMEVIKELLGIGESLCGHMMVVDALTNHVRKVKVPCDPACASCGQKGDAM